MQFELYNAILFYRELTTGHNTYFIFLTWLEREEKPALMAEKKSIHFKAK